MRIFTSRRWVDLPTAAEIARRVHERWLTRALALADPDALRVPARRVDEGGYLALLASPGGRERAEQFWIDAVARADSMIEG
jgi:hypothetical protein